MKDWDWSIVPQSSWFSWNWKELWTYRHLLLRLIRRDFLVHHQQTLLGPMWIVYQPIITLITYVLIFEKAVGLSTGGTPSYLFYFCGTKEHPHSVAMSITNRYRTSPLSMRT